MATNNVMYAREADRLFLVEKQLIAGAAEDGEIENSPSTISESGTPDEVLSSGGKLASLMIAADSQEGSSENQDVETSSKMIRPELEGLEKEVKHNKKDYIEMLKKEN